jgi:guanylate kinase
MNRGGLFIISAPSGVGKTTLCKALIKTLPGVALSVSYSTRAQRSGEQDGVHYHFVDLMTFEALLKAGVFLEHARVFNQYYGTSGVWLEEQRTVGFDVILEIDWQGARQVKEKRPEAQLIFILPPSLDVLRQRLESRHPQDRALVAERLGGLQRDLVHYSEYDYLVCNDHFENALQGLCAIVQAHRLGRERQAEAQDALLKSLLQPS